MKRSGPLTRRTPLRNGALRPGPGPKRSAPMKRRARLRPVSAKRQAENRVRRAVLRALEPVEAAR